MLVYILFLASLEIDELRGQKSSQTQFRTLAFVNIYKLVQYSQHLYSTALAPSASQVLYKRMHFNLGHLSYSYSIFSLFPLVLEVLHPVTSILAPRLIMTACALPARL